MQSNMAASAGNNSRRSPQHMYIAAAAILKKVKESGGSLLVLTGAGMSVMSGVPVFRNSDGSISQDFHRFLTNYNRARRAASLTEAEDWFSFSVPEMFRHETEKEAWAYWRWRILRALVEPAEDYRLLGNIINYFGTDKVFVQTSNCDMLHVKAGIPHERIFEIHGSLGRLQCSETCSDTLWDVDNDFIQRLRAEPDWIPRCPACKKACLRPNVMIFGDGTFIYTELEHQWKNLATFQERCANKNWIVLEIGAGIVIPSIRNYGEYYGNKGRGLIRINPSKAACELMESSGSEEEKLDTSKYFPLIQQSSQAFAGLASTLCL